jgi:hypothetical protein
MVSKHIIGQLVQCYDDVKNAIKFVLLYFHLKTLLVYQVVEIGIYIEHLLRECAKKGKYQQCPRCTEAIGNDFDVHIKLKECSESKPNTNRCPLCHMNIREGEKAWRDHLMGADGCVKNPRRIQALKKSNFILIKISFLILFLFR